MTDNTHGGARVGAGRPKGSENLRTNPRAREMVANGISPLEVELIFMRKSFARIQTMHQAIADGTKVYVNDVGDTVPVTLSALTLEEDRCFNMAQAAAPYCHARLAQVRNENSNSEDGPYQITIRKEDANL